MSKGKNQHVVSLAKEWAVQGAGNGRATRIVSTQQEAIAIEQLRLHAISNLTQKFMVETDKLGLAIVKATTLVHQKIKNKGDVYGSNPSIFC